MDTTDARKLHVVDKEIEIGDKQEPLSSTALDVFQSSTAATTGRFSKATITKSSKEKKRSHQDMKGDELDVSEDRGSTKSSFALSVPLEGTMLVRR